ncbi:MAG: thioredoxin-dependent thiol peroxidase [Flavobacteriales bacterium]|nr:thioredoxin-dependent thiol peroxidase [Flavobacteriales bacterium]
MSEFKIGDKAPDFTAKNQNGEEVSLSDYRGKKVILYFYPKDNTPGCTKESCDFRDNYESLTKDGFEVIGVSADSEKSHQKFIEKYDLPFTLISDTEKEVLNLYGAWGRKKFMGKEYDGILRKTFLINEDGKIEQIIEKVKTKEPTKQLLELLD